MSCYQVHSHHINTLVSYGQARRVSAYIPAGYADGQHIAFDVAPDLIARILTVRMRPPWPSDTVSPSWPSCPGSSACVSCPSRWRSLKLAAAWSIRARTGPAIRAARPSCCWMRSGARRYASCQGMTMRAGSSGPPARASWPSWLHNPAAVPLLTRPRAGFFIWVTRRP
jgi:hypothetical protein